MRDGQMEMYWQGRDRVTRPSVGKRSAPRCPSRLHHLSPLGLCLTLALGFGCQSLSWDQSRHSDSPTAPSTSAPEQQPEAGPQKADRAERSAAPPSPANPANWAPLTGQGREAMRQRNWAAAEDYYLQALAETEALSIHDARVRSALGNLLHVAESYQREGDYAAAERLIRVVVDQANVGRLAEFDTAEPIFAAQATHYEDEDRPEAAASLLEVGLHLYGSSAPSAINRRTELETLLGDAYLRLGQVPKASSLLLNTQDVAQSRFGPKSVEAAKVAVSVAALYAKQGNFERAEQTNQDAVSILEVHESQSLTLARAQSQLAQLYLDHGRAEDALPYGRAATEILSQSETTTPLLVTTLTTLATAETRSGDLATADRDYALALKAYEALPADEHTEETIRLLDHYAAFERSRGRMDQANALTQRAIRDRAALVQATPTAEGSKPDVPNR
ncbi:MAG: hypothetical protein CBC48_08515 [bacterium TMED88]|nr:hypothetical protein [Deltaproteobacteria bacterium]OUV32252.1 MAG: hypothetical protein CBC48_08515 [bacterium TMED88]